VFNGKHGWVMVTGGCGFIGSHLVDALVADGHPVGVLDALTWASGVNAKRIEETPGVRLVHGDVRSVVDLDRTVVLMGSEPIMVFHLAAESHVDRSLIDPANAFSVNAVGTMTVARWCAEHRYPMLYCSTDEVYGDLFGSRAAESGATEYETPILPSSPYSAGKSAGEHAVMAMCRSFGLRAVITRGCNAWGERQVPEKVVPLACRLLSQGLAVPLHGGGTQVRQWVHVSEFVDCMIRAAGFGIEHAAGMPIVFNIAGPVRLSVRELVDAIARVVDVPRNQVAYVASDRPGQDRCYNVKGQRALVSLGFKATRQIDDPVELKSLVEHYGCGTVHLAPWCNGVRK